MGVEHQFLGLAEVNPHERHAAVRQLHVRRLDRQRQPLKRDHLVAPVELIRFSGRKAHRYIGLGWNPGALVAPSLDEAMHAVVGAVIAASAQLLEQALCRTAFPPGEMNFLLQDLGQNRDPFAKPWRRLNFALVFMFGLVAFPLSRLPSTQCFSQRVVRRDKNVFVGKKTKHSDRRIVSNASNLPDTLSGWEQQK